MVDILIMSSPLSLPTTETLSTTLFLGDLSIYCQEKEIFALFRHFGPIESIQIKRSDDSAVRKPHLSYGFVKFQHRESAERALVELNRKVLMGRALRLGWAASNNQDRSYQPLHIRKEPTAQVHVTFLCPLDMYPITEEKLREIFESFGEILDVTINRAECNKESYVHSGYGFIHYPLNDQGVNAAVTAIQTMNDKIVDSIVLKCTMSHGLENYLKNRTSTAFAAAATIPRPSQRQRNNGSSFDSTNSVNSRGPGNRTSPTAAMASTSPFSGLRSGPPTLPNSLSTSPSNLMTTANFLPAHTSPRNSLPLASAMAEKEQRLSSIFTFNTEIERPPLWNSLSSTSGSFTSAASSQPPLSGLTSSASFFSPASTSSIGLPIGTTTTTTNSNSLYRTNSMNAMNPLRQSHYSTFNGLTTSTPPALTPTATSSTGLHGLMEASPRPLPNYPFENVFASDDRYDSVGINNNHLSTYNNNNGNNHPSSNPSNLFTNKRNF